MSARPAFDCGGSLNIAFVRNNRAISVRYDHTPIHQTVTQLFEFFKPPPSEVPAPVVEKLPRARKAKKRPASDGENSEEAPKKRRRSYRDAAAEDGEEGGAAPKKRQRKRKDATAEDGEGGEGGDAAPKKRQRKKKGATPDSPVMPPDFPGALPVGETARPTYGATASAGDNSYLDGLVGGGSSGVQTDIHANTILNVPPGEAARRREIANSLLTGANVDPKTLSTEQFNIFANQSPDLQKESLAMLAKYGAERLAIVHPSNREATNSPAPAQRTTPTAPVVPDASVVPAETPGPDAGKKRAGKKSGVAGEETPKKDVIVNCLRCRQKRKKVSRGTATHFVLLANPSIVPEREARLFSVYRSRRRVCLSAPKTVQGVEAKDCRRR